MLHRTGLDFVGLSDHCHADGRADFNSQWRGLHEGKLFLPGFEMKDGFMPFGVAPGVVLSNRTPPAVLAQQIQRHGGVLFFAHPENPRQWDLPELAGLEIYNLHTDFKRLGGGLGGTLRAHLPDLILNLRRFPDHIYRLPFQRPTEFLQRWDDLNRVRHITGIAGNDCHQNVGLRGFFTPEGTIRIEDTSPRVLREVRLTGLTRPLARLVFGPLEPGRKLFHVQLDPYERSARFVNTHVLARELSEAAVLDALRAGRVFVGFDLIADSSGFRWLARDVTHTTVMGGAHALTVETVLQAHAPIPCRFTLVRDGHVVARQQGRSVEWSPAGSGKYRVEADLEVCGAWVPWVYANPIHLH
ncbi:MAG: hypothetical protein FJ399_00950 [Verrucomicrobia bacterium]|nr:hypothetical protein [Verrucomicrobiota bacterium]